MMSAYYLRSVYYLQYWMMSAYYLQSVYYLQYWLPFVCLMEFAY